MTDTKHSDPLVIPAEHAAGLDAVVLQQEVNALRSVCAAAYQLAGLVGAPVRFLDVLGDAAIVKESSHD